MATSIVTSNSSPAPKQERRRRLHVDPRYQPVIGTFVVLIAMLIIGGTRYENFLSGRVMSNLLINNAFLVVLAVGMTFVILTGGIDLSVGAVVALSGCTAAWMFVHGWSLAVTLPFVIVVGALIGLGVGLMVHVFEIQPFIASLAAMFAARGLCYLIAPNSIPLTNDTLKSWARTHWEIGPFVLTPSGLIALAVVLIGFVVLAYSRFGRTVYAIGGNKPSALLMGLPVARSTILVYVVSGTCAGLAGVLFLVFSGSGYALTGVGMELDVIAAVVIGGTLLTGGSGFVLGSVLGVLVLGLIQTIITFEGTLSSWWTRIVIGALLLVFVVLQRVLDMRRR